MSTRTAKSIVDALIVEAVASTDRAVRFSARSGRVADQAATGRLPREMSADQQIDGPALIFDPSSTTVVEPGWQRDTRRATER